MKTRPWPREPILVKPSPYVPYVRPGRQTNKRLKGAAPPEDSESESSALSEAPEEDVQDKSTRYRRESVSSGGEPEIGLDGTDMDGMSTRDRRDSVSSGGGGDIGLDGTDTDGRSDAEPELGLGGTGTQAMSVDGDDVSGKLAVVGEATSAGVGAATTGAAVVKETTVKEGALNAAVGGLNAAVGGAGGAGTGRSASVVTGRSASVVSSVVFQHDLEEQIQLVKDEELFPAPLVSTQITLPDGRVIKDPKEVEHVLQGGAPAEQPSEQKEEVEDKKKFWEDMDEDEQAELIGTSSPCGSLTRGIDEALRLGGCIAPQLPHQPDQVPDSSHPATICPTIRGVHAGSGRDHTCVGKTDPDHRPRQQRLLSVAPLPR